MLDPNGLETLTRREKQVAEAYGQGRTFREIAEILGIAPATVRTHLQAIYKKLGVGRKTDLARFLSKANTENPEMSASANENPPELEAEVLTRPVVVVMPFSKIGNRDQYDFLCDGVFQDIVTRLSHVHDLSVVTGREPDEHFFQDTPTSNLFLPRSEFFLLQGSVQTTGTSARVSARLVDGFTGAVHWARNFDHNVTDAFKVQDEITHALVEALHFELIEGNWVEDQGGTKNFKAWELFHRGVKEHLRYSAENLLQARQLYTQAIELDSSFSDAKAMLAWTHWQYARSLFASDQAAEFARCGHVLSTLESEGADTPTIRHLTAVSHLMARDYDRAVFAANNAIAKGPSKVFGYAPASIALAYTGHVTEAVGILRKTIRLLPYVPNDTVYNLAWMYSLLQKHDHSVLLAKEYLKRTPNDPYAHINLIVCLSRAQNRDEATTVAKSFLENFSPFTAADFRAREPYRDQVVLETMVEALVDAGIPNS